MSLRPRVELAGARVWFCGVAFSAHEIADSVLVLKKACTGTAVVPFVVLPDLPSQNKGINCIVEDRER